MAKQEGNLLWESWRVVTGRAIFLTSCFSLFALLMLIDWRRSYLLFQIRTKDFSTSSEGMVHVNYLGISPNHILQGSHILHNYADDELVELAIQVQDRDQGHPRPTPKIAFLFLVVGDLPLEPLWRNFFKGNEESYNIYVHGDPSWLREYGTQERLGMFWDRTIPCGVTHRSNADIVAAERRLMANALVDDPSNEWFVLLSESCIPVRNFTTIYRTLNGTSNALIDCGKGFPGPMMMTRYLARGDTAMLPEVPFEEFRLGRQFFSIRKRHALMIMRDRKYWPKFRLPCIRHRDSCYPDEHYVQTVVGNLDEQACHGTPTFVSWNGSKGGHTQGFGGGDVGAHLIQAIKATQNGRYLFARKFARNTLGPLLSLTGLLFDR